MHGYDLLQPDTDHETCLMEACKVGCKVSAKFLLALPGLSFKHVNTSDKFNKRTALHSAAGTGCEVEALLRLRADPIAIALSKNGVDRELSINELDRQFDRQFDRQLDRQI